MRVNVSLPRETAAAAIGVLALGAAAVVTFVPWAIPLWIVEPTASAVVAHRATVLLVGLIAGAIGVHSLAQMAGEPDLDDTLRPSQRRLGRVDPPRNRTVGRKIDEALERLDADLADASPQRRRREQRTVKRYLREAVVTALSDSYDVSREEAATTIDEGTWTDDPRAASFLGNPEAPEPPLRVQIRDWASGKTFERNLEHTVDELAAIAGIERTEASS